jgi:hypothetical protein
MDGIPNGRISCELSNWSGKAYKIPRGFVKDCSDRPELNSTGVYILFGKSEENTKKEVAYIGEAENISINIADLDLDVFQRTVKNGKKIKTPPAG